MNLILLDAGALHQDHAVLEGAQARHALDVLNGVKGIAVTRFTAKDVVRHPLVQRIVEAYERESGDDGGAT